jgi:hypothetical protein
MEEIVVVKVGGSLMETARSLIDQLGEYASSSYKKIVIVPGGGVFADVVRECNVSEDVAHWMAILAMNQYGLYLSDGTKSRTVEHIDGISEGVSILLPYNLMRRNDVLAHNWNVTSDCIAAYMADKLGARFIKATDVDGIYIGGHLINEIHAREVPEERSCIDAELPKFLYREKMDCVIVNGLHIDRVIKAIRGKEVVSTRILGRVPTGSGCEQENITSKNGLTKKHQTATSRTNETGNKKRAFFHFIKP